MVAWLYPLDGLVPLYLYPAVQGPQGMHITRKEIAGLKPLSSSPIWVLPNPPKGWKCQNTKCVPDFVHSTDDLLHCNATCATNTYNLHSIQAYDDGAVPKVLSSSKPSKKTDWWIYLLIIIAVIGGILALCYFI